MRIGIDLGGTKIAVIALADDGRTLFGKRIDTPRGDYSGCLDAIRALVEAAETAAGTPGTVGVGMPGSLSPLSGRVQNANSTWLNGQPFQQDLQDLLGRDVRLANDANCFALSEAIDGAAAGARSVFGVIIGTGCGGGLVVDGRLIDGPRGIGGEWGHNPMPWMEQGEVPGPLCWCGLHGCMETFVSGPGLAADHLRHTGQSLTASDIATRAEQGENGARASLTRHASRLARGLAVVVNIFDPEVIVLGGGLSNMPHLYDTLPQLAAPFIFAEDRRIDIRPPRHGDDSGVRGAAWLWPPTQGQWD